MAKNQDKNTVKPKFLEASAAIISWLTAHSCLALGLPLTSGAAKPSKAVS